MAKESLSGLDLDDATLSEQQREIDKLRDQGMRRVDALVSSSKVFTRRDAELYKEDFSEQGMRRWGFITHEQQLESLHELLSQNIPEMERRSRDTENKFRVKIENAIGNKWIGRRSAARWMQRLFAENAYYWQKEMFIEGSEKFQRYAKNWEKVATERKKMLNNQYFKKLSSKDVSKLSVFKNEEDFLNRPYEERQNLVAAVQAAVAAKEKQLPGLHAKAKSMFEAAAASKAMSFNKIGVWMNRIFQSTANADLIEQFINGSGTVIGGQKLTLSGLIANWSDASKHFGEIEKKREKQGTPHGFHFVSMNVFLNWEYEKRRSYIQEANNRFKTLPKNDELLKIQHELDTKDWDSAEALITKSRSLNLSEEDTKRLQSLEKYLREHRKISPSSKTNAEQKPTPQEISKKLDGYMMQIPQQLRSTYRRSLRNGYQAFWATTVLMYNRVWCHQHGFYDSAKEQVMEQQSKDPTRDRMRDGHSETHEVNNVTGDTNDKKAIRKQAGIRKAQILFTDERSEETLTTEINEQKNTRDFWYWTSMIPRGVSYGEHLYVVNEIHPHMKKLARQLESMGLRYPVNGDGASMPAGKNALKAKPSMN
jgi:hypothetical protein